MDIDYLLQIAPKTSLTLLSPFCCVAVRLSFQVYFSRPRSERTVLIQASSGASFFCGASLFVVIVNYNLLDSLSIYALLCRALTLILGMVLNDFVVITRMRSLSHNMWTSLIVVTIVLCIVKYIGGIMIVVSLILRIMANDDGVSFPVQRLIICGGEMSTSVCFVIFWFRLLRHQNNQSKGEKNEKLTFFIKLVRTNIIFSSVILIILWGVSIFTDWVYNVVFDFLMMPGYFFALCPSAVITLTKDHQRMTNETAKGTAVILPVEYN